VRFVRAATVRRVAGRFVLGLIAALILDVLADVSGPLRIGKGYGWDGEYYVRMIEVGFKEGTPAMRLRPVVLLINAEVNRHLHNPRATFHAMNLVYAFTLAIALAALCQRSCSTCSCASRSPRCSPSTPHSSISGPTRF
jgi:hypothetical protein